MVTSPCSSREFSSSEFLRPRAQKTPPSSKRPRNPGWWRGQCPQKEVNPDHEIHYSSNPREAEHQTADLETQSRARYSFKELSVGNDLRSLSSNRRLASRNRSPPVKFGELPEW